MRCALPILCLLLGGCASTAPSFAWPQTFDTEIARVAGDEVVDCGFLNVNRGGSPAAHRRAARDCMARARQQNKAFKYGTVRVPIDSTASEVLVQTRQGTYLFIQDEMVLQNSVQRWSRRCERAEVDSRTGIISATGCSELPRVSQ
jgi:hypothetical protein